jgi:hypothetical protein
MATQMWRAGVCDSRLDDPAERPRERGHLLLGQLRSQELLDHRVVGGARIGEALAAGLRECGVEAARARRDVREDTLGSA